jgi:hypothetical protein
VAENMSTWVAVGVLPHGGGAIAILIAGIVMAVIAATVAVERRANVAVWTIGAFVLTFVVIRAALYLVTGT